MFILISNMATNLLYFALIFSLSVFKSNALLLEGDDCVVVRANNTLEPGKCINIEKCDYAKKLIEKRKAPQTCGFIRNSPLVCCPSVIILSEKILSFKTKSEEKCFEYQNPRLIGKDVAHGQKAQLREYPHMAAIGYQNKDNIAWLCGGSLISEEFILTAAHCVISRNFGSPKWIRLGDLDLNDTSDGAAPQNIAVNNTYVHPNYKSRSHYNDIALLKLQHPVQFNRDIHPACLQVKKELSQDKLEVTGWGKTSFLGETSNHLLKASLNLISYEKCSKDYASVSTRRLANGIVDEMQICAGGESGEDTCPGDSGGPLHYFKSGNTNYLDHFVVVGVTSFGRACGEVNSIGVYTRVSTYVPWIESIVWA